MGMTIENIEKITGKAPVLSESGAVYTITPPKTHPDFFSYVIRVSPTLGLYYIKALAKTDTSVYGTQLQDLYNKIKMSLSKTYGKYYEKDSLKVGSIWNEPRDWMTSLLKKERDLFCYWSKDDGATLPDDIFYVQLEAKALSDDSGLLVLDYYFSNSEAAEKERESLTESVF